MSTKKRGSRFEGEPRREVQVIFLSQASSPGLEWPERVDPAAERSTSSWQSQSEGLLGLLVNAGRKGTVVLSVVSVEVLPVDAAREGANRTVSEGEVNTLLVSRRETDD